MQSSIEEEMFDSFDTFWYFGYIFKYKYRIEKFLSHFDVKA